jgi:hypothetical protein
MKDMFICLLDINRMCMTCIEGNYFLRNNHLKSEMLKLMDYGDFIFALVIQKEKGHHCADQNSSKCGLRNCHT